MKVSVCIVTYNQCKYIRECLDSIVNQETNFLFEVIVGDDASTDGTREIVSEFCEKYPTLVKAVFHETNVGSTKNYFSVHNLAQGEYIAHLDGDDYALPGKLKKQSDFLDHHLECCFVAHRVVYVDKDSKFIHNIIYKDKNIPLINNFEFLIKNTGFFVHSSKMYRRSANIFDHSNDDFLLDFFIHVEHASIGKIGFIPEKMGVYRINTGGSSTKNEEMQSFLCKLKLDGFERARQLGVTSKIVDYGKKNYLLRRHFSFLLARDFVGYKKNIKTSNLRGGLFINLVLFVVKYRPPFTTLLIGLRRLIERGLFHYFNKNSNVNSK